MKPSTNGTAIAVMTGTKHAIEPWDRQSGEPDRAWDAFRVYRDLGLGRSYAKAREKLGRKPGYDRQIEEWGRKHDWRDRTFAFDVAEDRRERARMDERKAQMELAQERAGMLGTALVIARMEGGSYTAPDGTEFDVEAMDPNKLDPYRLVALLAEATRTWRLAHGQPIDFTKGVFMLSSTDVARIVEKMMEAAYDFWGTDDCWALFVDRVRSIPTAR